MILQILQRELPRLRRQYGVTQLALYGSFARDQATEASDVDVLVELSHPLGFEFVTLAEELERALGRQVDLTTFAALDRSRRSPRYGRVAEEIEGTLVHVEAQA